MHVQALKEGLTQTDDKVEQLEQGLTAVVDKVEHLDQESMKMRDVKPG